MATYPQIANMTVLPVSLDDGSRVRRSYSGTNRIQRLYEQTMYRFDIGFVLLTAAQWSTILQFYETNKYDSQIEFTDPNTGIAYLVQMLSPPQITGRAEGTYLSASHVIEGVISGD